ncbi:2-keto-4-pentenoate hydratase [Arthrobacter sp. ov407]|uniref:2-keto-4-pentenoate hydratase n=1 Tax=Arthrobacter sp. ov407 TaxID=1761748 RepID=UPI000886618B|nr:fumarylacetoacetate hydrolase family protein [Arthrobacter sp. ov407]SDK93788.1 2-keto-4-pentenoate hydratase [Arthrobacter sp. ov407]
MTHQPTTANDGGAVTTGTSPTNLRSVANTLLGALKTARPCGPVREVLQEDLDSAYEVQELIIQSRTSLRNRRIGRKVGLTAPAVQRQLGVDQPDFGVLLSDMQLGEDEQIPHEALIAPRIEAEIAFILGRDVDATDRDSVLAAVDYVAPALEIVDSRIAEWDIGIVDTVADNASSAYFILGQGKATLNGYVPAGAEMVMTINGVQASMGTGADCLGDPINALLWIAETATALGRPLRAGEIVLSGALGPMAPLNAGDIIEARIGGLGTVTATVTKEHS